MQSHDLQSIARHGLADRRSVPAWVPGQRVLRKQRRLLDPDAAVAEVAPGLREQRARRRVVEVDVHRIRHGELHFAERILGPGTLADPHRPGRDGRQVGRRNLSRQGVAVAGDEFHLLTLQIAWVTLQSRQDFAACDRDRHIPVREEVELVHLGNEHRRRRPPLLADHHVAFEHERHPPTVQRIAGIGPKPEIRDVDADDPIRRQRRQPAQTFQRQVDLAQALSVRRLQRRQRTLADHAVGGQPVPKLEALDGIDEFAFMALRQDRRRGEIAQLDQPRCDHRQQGGRATRLDLARRCDGRRLAIGRDQRLVCRARLQQTRIHRIGRRGFVEQPLQPGRIRQCVEPRLRLRIARRRFPDAGDLPDRRAALSHVRKIAQQRKRERDVGLRNVLGAGWLHRVAQGSQAFAEPRRPIVLGSKPMDARRRKPRVHNGGCCTRLAVAQPQRPAAVAAVEGQEQLDLRLAARHQPGRLPRLHRSRQSTGRPDPARGNRQFVARLHRRRSLRRSRPRRLRLRLGRHLEQHS